MNKHYPVSRRDYLTLSAAAISGAALYPRDSCSMSSKVPAPLMRTFGNTGYKVTTLGLGGQGSIQWTPDDVDPAAIIQKAFDLGINFFDTSNMYGPSQVNYNAAFNKLNLIPGEAGYNAKLRESIYLTSKTLMRWGRPGWPEVENVRNVSNGEEVQCAVGDLKRALSQVYGDDDGNYPKGAYFDFFLIHSITGFEEVDVLYRGIETPLDPDENFGALVALRDYRDGTNLTGTNPKKEKLIRHLGFSGHNNPPAMIDMIQRDEDNLMEAMLVSMNANDKLYFNMQNNVMPVARAKGLGIIGMKVFADAVMYGKEARFSQTPVDVYRKVGSPELPSHQLIEYVLNSPDIDTLIIGTGHVDDDPLKCQLTQNYYAAQFEPNSLSAEELKEIERKTAKINGGQTNYFQLDKNGLSSPRDIQVETVGGKSRITWQTAYAADAPISCYEVVVNGVELGEVPHRPQTLKSKPFVFETDEPVKGDVVVRTVDADGDKSYARIKGTIARNVSN
ncbi:aldo/keto reductase [Pontiellaceae bacterium B12227]|nr:aldo/keto reductase [Pontiellaceae bacterium B12227]